MFLYGLWYFAIPAEALKHGALQRKILLGEPVLLGRTHGGEAFALRDICPHRAVPLSAGRMDRDLVECPYHGWKFHIDGACALIPSLVEGQSVDTAKIRVRRYPVRELQGNIWIYISDEARADLVPDHEPPLLPGFATDRSANIRESMVFHCHVDHAVVGLMDPAHGPFVHRAWWWRSARSIHEKTKDFAPSDLGFTMVEHRPSSNSAAYRVLGGAPTTEIGFRLPGVRVENIKVGRHRLVGLTSVTPIDAHSTEITQSFYWTMPFLSITKPLVRSFMRAFLGQDRDMVNLQQQGLRFDPKLMLINDADVQAKWYYRLKSEWMEAREQGRPFLNPVKAANLRWRS